MGIVPFSACIMPSEACIAGCRGMPCPTGALFLALIFFSRLQAAATCQVHKAYQHWQDQTQSKSTASLKCMLGCRAYTRKCSHGPPGTTHLTAVLPQVRKPTNPISVKVMLTNMKVLSADGIVMQKESDLARCHSIALTLEGTSYEREPAFQSSSSASDTPLGALGAPVQPGRHSLCCT